MRCLKKQTPLVLSVLSLLASQAGAQSVLFDFDSTPNHTPLPIDLTVGDLTASFDGTGQSYSIQLANISGVGTPEGFAGNCLYPDGFAASDLLVSFSHALQYASIMYAPSEQGCDSSARMRITGLMGGVEVATSTTTAPAPGTWPTGVLTLSYPQGFDSVVIHYDAAPLCGDSGQIFVADNMTVTPLPIPPALSIDDVAVAEGNAGTATLGFTVSLSAVSDQTVTVGYATENWTATTADGDYVAASGTLTFAPGVTTQPVNVTVNGDVKIEANEILNVNLSAPTNATISDNQGIGTILNDDAVPALSIDDVAIAEGNAGTTTLGFTVSLSAVSGQTVTVGYATANGTATTADGDYLAASGTLTFAPGVTTQPVSVTVNGDVKPEANETLNVNLSAPTNATISDNQGVGTITNDDDAVPALSINDVAVAEGNAGTTTLGFTVSLSTVSGQTVTVAYATVNGTATTADGDYLAASGTLTFAPGETTQPVSLTVNGDVKNEANETLVVDLSEPANATILDGQGTGTITDDDAVPTLSIDDVAVAEGNAGTTTLGFTVSLSAVSGQTVTVGYATANGTATTADGDYLAASGTLTFAPGVTTQPVSVTVSGDVKNEANETFVVDLSGPVNATISDSQGTGTINNDDAATYLLTVSTAGPGSGSVTSSPPGIDCGADCTESYAAGTVVTLTAASGPSSTFEGWSGGSCSGTSLVCQVTMDTARSATATFALAAPTGTAYYTVSPCRVLDSRVTTGPWGGQPLGAQQERTVMVVGACAIPATAKALSFNVTATASTAAGHIRVYPAGTPRPGTSSLNFAAGQTRANNGIVNLGAAGGLAFFSGQASGSVHVVLDVNGYFE